MSQLDPEIGRRTFRTVEPIHAMIYFTPHGPVAYEAAGLRGPRMGYFASRAAPMGPVPAEVVMATFFNFSPALIRRCIPEAWSLAAPSAVLEARLEAVDRSLHQAWGDGVDSAEVVEAAGLARRAAEHTFSHLEGRPLFAAHAQLPWPGPAHLVLWHAETLLREFRGDGHVALLASSGLDAVEALVIHAATGEVPAEVLRSSRDWSEEEWAAGVERVRQRGWLEPGPDLTLNPAGRTHRREVEAQTDALAVGPYAVLGAEGCARLRTLARPLSIAVMEAGLMARRPLPEEPVSSAAP